MSSIPRTIHQTWMTSQLPPPFAAYQAQWRALHPDYSYRLWTDADNDELVKRCYPAWYELYRSFDREIFRADMARCLYLHQFGGVYADIDIEPLRPLTRLLAQHTCLLGTEPEVHAQRLWNKSRLVSNALMASTPGHPFWLRMLDEIARRAASAKNPVATTGPITLDAVYERHGAALGVSLAEPDAFFPLPDLDNTELQLSAASTQHYRNMIALAAYPSEAWGVHHWAHTWISTQAGKRFLLRTRERARDLLAVLRSQRTIDEVLRRGRYGLQFPEQAFPPRASRRDQYQADVARGAALARQQSVSVLVLLHDRIDLALMLRARLSALLEPFARAQVFVISDDSTDGTHQVIVDWQRAEPARVHSVPAPRLADCRSVYERMARLRNALLQRSAASASDLTLVVDGDLAGPISLDGLKHAVSVLDGTAADGVAAFGINNWGGLPGMLPFLGYSYYDPIAFREHSFARTLSDPRVRLRLSGLRRGDAALPVKSAFAGLALYKSAALHGLRYDESTDDCEHVSLHRGLRDGLVIDPALLLLSGRQGHHQAGLRARQDAPRSVLGHREHGSDRVHTHAAREHAGVAHEQVVEAMHGE
jgi:inositol phosphorylceramide mannosyltransferase catalytic subunit